MIKEIGIIGNDLRMNYLKKLYLEEGYDVIEDYKYSSNVISPIPFTRDDEYITGTNIKILDIVEHLKDTNVCIFSGSVPDEFCELFKENNIKCYDLLKFEDIAILNDIPTAEGAIYTAMEKTNITICNSNCLILGNGKIGKILSKMLNGIGAKVTVCARKDKDFAYIKSMGYEAVSFSNLSNYLNKFDYIFNTVPSLILTKDKLAIVKKEVCIIDLASVEGVDYNYAKNNNINLIKALALPTKIAPLSAAVYLKNKIDMLK